MIDTLPLTHARIEQWREDGLINLGLQLYISFEGERVIDTSQGEARPGIAMSTDTLCRQHCTAAPLTAFALAPLVAERQVGLDQPVSDFIPEFAPHGKSRITLRHVLTHTAGLHACDTACLMARPEDILATVSGARLPPGWAPGSAANYSHIASWHLLGAVIEAVVGASLGPYLRESLFLPLGMTGTWVGMTGEQYDDIRDSLGVIYYQETNQNAAPGGDDRLAPVWLDLSKEACTPSLAFDAYAPAHDLGYFYEALLDRDRLADSGIVEPSVAEKFVSVQRSGLYDAGLGRVCDYGFGFMVNLGGHHFGNYISPLSYGHSGINGSSVAFADEENQLVVALLLNDVLDWETCFLRRTAIVNSIYKDLGLG